MHIREQVHENVLVSRVLTEDDYIPAVIEEDRAWSS